MTLVCECGSQAIEIVDATYPEDTDGRPGVRRSRGDGHPDTECGARRSAVLGLPRQGLRGVALTGTSEKARQALVGPISVAPIDDVETAGYAQIVDEFSIHDGMIVASHRV